jgi:HAD superfamily hydrolase (TIGR01509 family)
MEAWMPAPALIIFDCDGVLVDSELLSIDCMVSTLHELGIDINHERVFDKFLGVSAAGMLRTLENDYDRTLPEDFLISLQQRTLAAFRAKLQPVTGVSRLLQRLSVPRCVASSSTPERIRLALEVTGLLNYLDPHIFSASMVRHGKPAPDLFLYAAAQMNAVAAACLVIEDSLSGVRAAKAAGMQVFGFTGGSHILSPHYAGQLEQAGADRLFDNMNDLPAMLDEL